MKTKRNGNLIAVFVCLISGVGVPAKAEERSAHPPGYVQVNLVSDIASNAPHLDARLVNPWGLVVGPGAVWVADNGTSLTTAYGQSGQVHAGAIHVPAPGGGDGAPSGLVFNESAKFVITNGTAHGPATFLMATEGGTITAWNHSVSRSNAVIVVDNSASGAVYKGLALARDTNGAPRIYAANFHAGSVDVYDAQFKFLFSFTDPELPDGYAPFNVAWVHGHLFVAYAVQRPPELKDDFAGAGHGIIDIFDSEGNLLRRFASHGVLNSPWGMVYAPPSFGPLGGSLLVGNFGDGTINAFDLLTGKWLGALTSPAGTPIFIEGLWGLAFEREAKEGRECDFIASRLYFTAGINAEADGLFGVIHGIGRPDKIRN